MNLNIPIRAATRRLVSERVAVRQSSEGCERLRIWLRAISTTSTASTFRRRTTPVVTATRSCRSVPQFSTSARLAKKDKKAAPLPKGKNDAGGADDPKDFTVLEEDINTAHDKLKEALSKLRSGGRFNHEVIERLRVQPDKDDKSKVALSDVAQVIPKGRTLQIIVGEKDHVKAVSSAIMASDLSLTPQPDPTGTNPLLLEIKIPPPTAESRQNAVKEAVKAGDKASEAIRDARAKQHKKHRAMQSVRTITPDTLRKAGADMEKVVEKAQAEVKKTVDNAKKMLEAV